MVRNAFEGEEKTRLCKGFLLGVVKATWKVFVSTVDERLQHTVRRLTSITRTLMRFKYLSAIHYFNVSACL
jgi:hypothetical protein